MGLLLLCQTFIPIQTHTRWAMTDSGQVVEVCTLHHGAAAVERGGDLVGNPGSDRTAAMTFSLLMASAIAGDFEIQPAWLALLSLPVPPAVIGRPVQRSLRFAPIRAPPSLV